MITYPDARLILLAQTYGELAADTALVLHTTETKGNPGYRAGLVAPHFEYNAARREWRQLADPTLRVGTMKGSSSTGIPANEKAIQVEIVAYSSPTAAEQSGGIWVGEFTDDHYADLARFVGWARDVGLLDATVTPTPDGGWRSGAHASTRLTVDTWAAFRGLTCHGAVPGQTHWDTGVLDLERISRMAGGHNMISTARWASRMRDADIARLVELGILNMGEADYWVGLLARARDESDTAVDWEYVEWQDLRDAVDVRRPIYT